MTGCVRHPQAYPWPRADGVCCAICGGPYTAAKELLARIKENRGEFAVDSIACALRWADNEGSNRARKHERERLRALVQAYSDALAAEYAVARGHTLSNAPPPELVDAWKKAGERCRAAQQAMIAALEE